MLLLSGIVLKLVTPEHGLPQARFTEAWQKTTLSTVVWETGNVATLAHLCTFTGVRHLSM